MILWADACKQAGYDQDLTCPVTSYSWFAYKNGEAKQFQTKEEAKKFSKIIERVADPITKAESDAFINKQLELAGNAATIWFESLKAEYGKYPAGIFALCYEQAYNNAYEYGYDEIANNMAGVVDFAARIAEFVRPDYE